MTIGIATCTLHRHKSAPSVNSDKPGYFISGEEIKINDVVTGDTFEGVQTWYKLEDELYVWSGGVSLNLGDPIFTKKIELDKAANRPALQKLYNPQDYWWISDYGVDKLWKLGMTGRGVKIAVFDSGLTLPHPDLPMLPEKNIIDITGNNRQNEDIESHGTHVFGIMSAINNGFGITGVCHNSEFFFSKIEHFDTGYSHEYLTKAIDWAINNQVDIISISHGSSEITDAEKQNLENSITNAINKGVAIICSAGNDGGNVINRYPAKFSENMSIFSVSHTNRDKRPLDDTIINNKISIYAPGFKILSTVKDPEHYAEKSGSSFSTPFVSGLVSLVLESQREKNPSCSALEAINLLLENSEVMEYGKLINLKKLYNI